METTQELRRRQPLAGLSPPQRRAIYDRSGMHSPNPNARTDADAFEVRNDVCVEDACWTALRMVRMAVAQLELLEVHPDLDDSFRNAVSGIANLSRFAGGAIGLVHSALCIESQPGTPAPSRANTAPAS